MPIQRPVALLVLALFAALLIWRFSSLSGTDDGFAIAPESPRAAGVGPDPPDTALAESVLPTNSREVAETGPAPTDEETGSEKAAQVTTGSLLLRAVSAEGAPVVGVTVYVTPKRGPRQGNGTTAHVTDEEGLARAADLPPGRITVFCPNGILRGADVRAGQETEVVLEFERLLEVHGVVRTPDGRPIANADVWLLSWRRDWLGTFHLTRSGPNGEFVVANVPAEKSVGATAAGFGPSAPLDLELLDTTASPIELELTLTPNGGELTGRVLDPEGDPVPGARVAVGASPPDYAMRNDGTLAEAWGPRSVTTEADGSFAFAGLAAGTLPLHALAADYPEFAGEAEIVAGETTYEELQLVRGMSVRGVVRNEGGEVVPDALVLALDAPFVDPFPSQGPTERGVPFHRPATRTDDAGAYLLDHLPPGEVHLYASKGTSFWDDGDFVGTVQASLTGAAGEVLAWNPVLSRGLLIRGRVLYADGKPMGNVFVSATDSDGRRYTEDADADGRFSISGLEARGYRVSVQIWSPPEGALPLEQDDVWPAETELTLTASFAKVVLEKATARVRIDDRADRVTGKGGVMFAHDRGMYFTDEEDGVFSAELPPGRYQARVLNGDSVVGAGDWFELAPGEERDLGAVVTRAAGSVIVRVRRPPELAVARVYVSLETDHTPKYGAREVPDGGELTFPDLLEGEVTLRLGGPGVAVVIRRATVRADAPTTVEFEVLPAEPVRLRVSATPSAGFGKLEVVVRHADGRPYSTLDYYEIWGAKLPIDARVYAPEGDYVVTATTTSGLSATGEFHVEAAAAETSLSLVLE